MTVAAVIQARMKSTRLPGKVLMDVCGKTMLQRVIERVKATKYVDEIIVAVPDTPEDYVIEKTVEALGATVFHGSENDVLERYYFAVANRPDIDTIVRVTSDCPLIDPHIINRAVKRFQCSNADYLFNTNDAADLNKNNLYPDGMDVEVFSRAALSLAFHNATDPKEREHVTLHMLRSDDFVKRILEYRRRLPRYHWSVNTAEDLEFVRWIYRTLDEDFTLEDILKLVEGEKDEVHKIPRTTRKCQAPHTGPVTDVQ